MTGLIEDGDVCVCVWGMIFHMGPDRLGLFFLTGTFQPVIRLYHAALIGTFPLQHDPLGDQRALMGLGMRIARVMVHCQMA